MPSRRPNGSPPLPLRSVRVPRDRLARAQEQAYLDGLTLSAVLNTYLLAYAGRNSTVPPITTPIPQDAARLTWRATDNLWDYFRARVEAEEGHTLIGVVNGFLEEYGRGLVSTSGAPFAEVGV